MALKVQLGAVELISYNARIGRCNMAFFNERQAPPIIAAGVAVKLDALAWALDWYLPGVEIECARHLGAGMLARQRSQITRDAGNLYRLRQYNAALTRYL